MKRTHEAWSKWGLDCGYRLRCRRAAGGVAKRPISSGPSFRCFRLWRVDPCGGWFGGWDWRFFDETLRVLPERLIEGELAGRVNCVDLAVMHLVRGHEADPAMVMVLVVPVEETAAEAGGILDATETFRESRLIFQRLEVALRERVIVGDMWSVM